MKSLYLLLLLFSVNAFAHPSDYPANSMAAGPNAGSAATAQAVEEPAQAEATQFEKLPEVEVAKTQTVEEAAQEAAQIASKTQQHRQSPMALIVQNSFFKNLIDIALILVAFVSWIGFMSSFDPARAFQQCLAPAMMTFLAFQWVDVLRWLNLGL